MQGLEPIEQYIGFKLPFTFPEEGELARDIRHAPRERRDHHAPQGHGPQRRRGGGPAAVKT